MYGTLSETSGANALAAKHGGAWLLIITLLAVSAQFLKLGSRYLVLHENPAMSQWGQVGIVLTLLIYLWEGKSWAPVVLQIYYLVGFIAGTVIEAINWQKSGTAMNIVQLLILAIVINISLILAFSSTLRAHLEERRLRADT